MRADGGFPEELETVIERVEMSAEQYRRYLLAREKEEAEGTGGEGGGPSAKSELRVTNSPDLSLPGSEAGAGSTYYVKSRTLGNFAPPRDERDRPVAAMPDSAFSEETSPKATRLVANLARSPGPALIYSQFVDVGGLAAVARFLRNAGYEEYALPPAPAKRGGASKAGRHRGRRKPPRPRDGPCAPGREPESAALAHVLSYLPNTPAGDAERREIARLVAAAPKPVSPWMDEEAIPPGVSRRRRFEPPDIKIGHIMNLHRGQRKLFISELLGFTHFMRRADEEVVVVYAGAAAGHHLPYLARLYPGAEFHLFDPAPFAFEEGTARLNTYRQFFTDDTAREWTGRCDIFVCDIRLAEPDRTQATFERQVAIDMAAQDRWSRLIEPRLGSVLKFRPPYLDEDFSVLGQDTYEYLKGRVMWQVWPPKSSTEGRLIVEAEDSTLAAPPMTYDVRRHEDACYAHNQFARSWTRYEPPGPGLSSVRGFDGCFDCALEAWAWEQYVRLPGAAEPSAAAGMKRLTSRIKQTLVGSAPPYHGMCPRLPPVLAIRSAIKDLRARPQIVDEFIVLPEKGAARGGAEGAAGGIAEYIVDGGSGPEEEEEQEPEKGPGQEALGRNIAYHVLAERYATRGAEAVGRGGQAPRDDAPLNSSVVAAVFKQARGANMLVSFANPRESFEPEGLKPPSAAAPKPMNNEGGLLWLSVPEVGKGSWYDYASRDLPDYVDLNRKAIVGYELDEGRLLRVGTAGEVEAFEKEYGVCPPDLRREDQVLCEESGLIDWAKVAEKWGGVAFDPYIYPVAASHEAEGAPYRIWYSSLDAATYIVWDPGAVRKTAVLYRPSYPDEYWDEGEGREGGADGPAPRYAIISGGVKPDDRARIQEVFNSPANAHGELIRALLVSKTGAEGLDLKGVRQVHILEPYWDKSREDQVKARGVRLGSHDHLPVEEREVQPFLYIAAANREMFEGMRPTAKEEEAPPSRYRLVEEITIDEKFHARALVKHAINGAFRRLLRDVCLECSVNGYGDCRLCVPTDAPLFHEDPIRDLRLPDSCQPLAESELSVQEVSLPAGDGDGATTTYFYREDPAAPFGVRFFAYDEELEAHSPVDPASGLFLRLLEVLRE